MKSQIIAIFFAESISCTQKRGQNGERAPEFSFRRCLLMTMFIKNETEVFLWYYIKVFFHGIMFNFLLMKDCESFR